MDGLNFTISTDDLVVKVQPSEKSIQEKLAFQRAIDLAGYQPLSRKEKVALFGFCLCGLIAIAVIGLLTASPDRKVPPSGPKTRKIVPRINTPKFHENEGEKPIHPIAVITHLGVA